MKFFHPRVLSSGSAEGDSFPYILRFYGKEWNGGFFSRELNSFFSESIFRSYFTRVSFMSCHCSAAGHSNGTLPAPVSDIHDQLVPGSSTVAVGTKRKRSEISKSCHSCGEDLPKPAQNAVGLSTIQALIERLTAVTNGQPSNTPSGLENPDILSGRKGLMIPPPSLMPKAMSESQPDSKYKASVTHGQVLQICRQCSPTSDPKACTHSRVVHLYYNQPCAMKDSRIIGGLVLVLTPLPLSTSSSQSVPQPVSMAQLLSQQLGRTVSQKDMIQFLQTGTSNLPFSYQTIMSSARVVPATSLSPEDASLPDLESLQSSISTIVQKYLPTPTTPMAVPSQLAPGLDALISSSKQSEQKPM